METGEPISNEARHLLLMQAESRAFKTLYVCLQRFEEADKWRTRQRTIEHILKTIYNIDVVDSNTIQ